MSWLVIHSKYEHYYRLLASPLEMYSKFVLLDWTLFGRIATKVDRKMTCDRPLF